MTKQKGRRGYGEGSIFQRADGAWVCTINIGYDATGKRKRRTVYGKTKKEVQEKLTKLQLDAANGALAMEPQRLTIAQYLANWLENDVRLSNRKSTYLDYECIVRVHINPLIGGLSLAKLSPVQVQAMFGAMERAKASARMRQKAYAVLHRALNQAVKLGLVARNVCHAVEKAKPKRVTFQVLNPEQVVRFWEAAEADRLHAMYVLAVATGLRQGELFALRWEDIDITSKRLSVVHQLIELKGEMELGEPKSATGRRSVTLPDFAVQVLREHRFRMNEEGHESPWVFCATTGTWLRKSNVIRRSFKPILKRAELPDIRFHDLRHTAATLLLAQEVHAKIVQERLGHSQISLTLDTYSHVLPSMQQVAADRLDSLFSPKRPKPGARRKEA